MPVCQTSQAGASTSPSASQHYQLAGRPSEEVRAAEKVVETAARCVSLQKPLASEGASMRARSRRSAPTSQLGMQLGGDVRRQGDEDCLPLLICVVILLGDAHKSRTLWERGGVMRAASSGKTAPLATRAS